MLSVKVSLFYINLIVLYRSHTSYVVTETDRGQWDDAKIDGGSIAPSLKAAEDGAWDEHEDNGSNCQDDGRSHVSPKQPRSILHREDSLQPTGQRPQLIADVDEYHKAERNTENCVDAAERLSTQRTWIEITVPYKTSTSTSVLILVTITVQFAKVVNSVTSYSEIVTSPITVFDVINN